MDKVDTTLQIESDIAEQASSLFRALGLIMLSR